MPQEEFYLKQILDGIKDSIDNVKDTMANQHNAFGVKLDMLLDRQSVTDRKTDKSHERIDAQNIIINSIKDIADRALELGEDYNDNKKKVIFGGSLLVGIGVGAKWVFDLVFK